jgi:hypothetical protein
MLFSVMLITMSLCTYYTIGQYEMIMVTGKTASISTSLSASRIHPRKFLYPITNAFDDSNVHQSNHSNSRSSIISKQSWIEINTLSLLQVRGGSNQYQPFTNMNRIRVPPSTIPDSSSKTKSSSSFLNPTTTSTEVKEQIDAFLTRDSRNTFIGMYGVAWDVKYNNGRRRKNTILPF